MSKKIVANKCGEVFTREGVQSWCAKTGLASSGFSCKIGTLYNLSFFFFFDWRLNSSQDFYATYILRLGF